MSEPTNSAARNAMTEWERQCYDWGWEDSEERIIKLLEDDCSCRSVEECYCTIGWAIELIKGENNGN